MTAQEAKNALLKGMPDWYIRGGLEFENFYAFFLVPKDIPKNEPYEAGPYMTAIDKKTGEIFDYDIRTDPDAYLDAKEIK